MKRWIALLLLLVISPVLRSYACGFYPWGEDVRMYLLQPSVFGFGEFELFQYTTTYLNYGNLENSADENISQWAAYCKGNVARAAISEAVYTLPAAAFSSDTCKNSMVLYLKKQKDVAAINYLVFAKSCEGYNLFYSDPWERTDVKALPQAKQQLEKGLALAKTESNPELRSRYAFLVIRMQYYAQQKDELIKTYQSFFQDAKNKSTIYYWAMHFRALVEKDSVKQNFMMAQVFYHAPQKRFQAYQYFDKTVSLSATLSLAKTDQERAAVYFLDALHNPGKADKSIAQIAKLDPHSKALQFLFLREISKMEDWIFTPYYTFFNRAITDHWSDEPASKDKLISNIPKDRKYDELILGLLRNNTSIQQDNPIVYHTALAWLSELAGQHEAAIEAASWVVDNPLASSAQQTQANQIRAIATVASQPQGAATITTAMKPILMENWKTGSQKFLFALARELEFKGATKDAALLLSKVNDNSHNNGFSPYMFWKNRKGQDGYTDYYSDYFFYIDAVYTPEELQELMQHSVIKDASDSFRKWVVSTVVKDYNRLQDMLGTKYIRLNKLKEAAAAFAKVNDTLYKQEGFYTNLNANPFYTDLYNEHKSTVADTVRFTKGEITRKLIDLLEQGEQVDNPNRAKAYYQAATCYLNMTYFGNSWMMRRFYWSGSEPREGLVDDTEFYTAALAKKYYLKAKETARNKSLAALSLRMAGRCEKYRLMEQQHKNTNYYYSEGADDKMFADNKYWKQLQREFPNDYEPLISNCLSFYTYYAKR